MLFQLENTLLLILWFVVATVIVALILFIVVLLIESKTKAKDKIILEIVLAIIFVLILPYVLGLISSVLGVIGDLIIWKDGNYLILLVPIIGFLIVLVLVKYLLDVAWDNALWISLLMLFFLFLLYTLIPGLATFLGFNLT
jgi:hypothetical protein